MISKKKSSLTICPDFVDFSTLKSVLTNKKEMNNILNYMFETFADHIEKSLLAVVCPSLVHINFVNGKNDETKTYRRLRLKLIRISFHFYFEKS